MYCPSSNILVVDDMLSMRKLVVRVLKELNFSRLSEASDATKAWKVMTTASKPFDIVVSDWNMPNGTGLDFLKQVRADPRFEKIPFFLLTSEADDTQVLDAAKAGVTGYILKPFTTDSIREQLIKGFTKMKQG